MNITLNCKISLSKKLRALIGKKGVITLLASDLVDGKGLGTLSISSEYIKDDFDTIDGETSIQLEPLGKTLVDIDEYSSCSNLFTSLPPEDKEEEIVSKMAVVNPPERKKVSTAMKSKEQINAEASISSAIPDSSCQKWIKNREELMEELRKSKNKRSDIDVSVASTDRERAVMMEMKEKEEAIDKNAWIVNDKYGNLQLNDLGVSLPKDMPYDLRNISARRLLNSKELNILLRDKFIRFVSPEERDRMVGVTKGEEEHGLKVFDNHEKARSSIENGEDENEDENEENEIKVRGETIMVDEADLDAKTEEEDMILNLTQDMSSSKTSGSKKTIHGSSRPIPSGDPSKNKTISRKF